VTATIEPTALDAGAARHGPASPDGRNVVIIGAGPAGLTAAYQLAKAGWTSTVLEADSVVGGLSRTVVADGYRFDIGGHRFFTKVPAVQDLWHDILPAPDLLERTRSSRIYYRGKFFDYPLDPFNALGNLGPVESLRCTASYLAARLRPPADQSTLEGYVHAHYGRRLFRHFFEAYTAKVWGKPACELSADWGAQRIRDMSLARAVWEPLRARLVGPRADASKQVTSLIDRFHYPRLGPGMMWERCRDLVVAAGSDVVLDAPVVRVDHCHGRAVTVTTVSPGGQPMERPVDHLISSMPLPDLLAALHPAAPEEVLATARGLGYRDFICVALVVPADKVGWTDNWIYVHDPAIRAMRVQNFAAWSPDLVRDGRNVLGLEYTVDEGDDTWTAPDTELIARAAGELDRLGLMGRADVEAGYVTRMAKAYPIYDEDYGTRIAQLRAWMAAHLHNVHPVGRNGMHRYNNQDHSMYTAMLTVENIVFGCDHDVWSVNVDGGYHEAAPLNATPHV
jgi:protoporphyrinogen oxidase